MQPNPDGEAICCLTCGRDTTAKWGYCARCLRHYHRYSHPGFSGISAQAIASAERQYEELPLAIQIETKRQAQCTTA